MTILLLGHGDSGIYAIPKPSSYQLTILNRTTGQHHSVLIEPVGPTRRHRLSLGHLLAKALLAARTAGIVEAWPEVLALVAHFSRADLTTLRDWKDLRTR